MANAAFIPEVINMVNEGHTVTIPLRGYSMRPFLEDRRDKAVLVAASQLCKGDVVLAEIGHGHYVLHRIIKIDGNTITLRGDGNIKEEKCVRENIKAQAIGFYRKNNKTMNSTNSLKWKLYSAAWSRLYPIRRYLLFIYRYFNKNNYQ